MQLQGEPDNERLGKRLKGDFKKVGKCLSHLANAMVEIASFPGTRKIGGNAWYTLFAHVSLSVLLVLSLEQQWST